jgi:hypothetical protein
VLSQPSLAGRSFGMQRGISRSALVLAGLLGGASIEAHAQAPTSALDARADSQSQAAAAALARTLVSRPLFIATGERVGQIDDVVVAPDGNGTVALVTVRPRFGWGRIAVSTRLLQQAQGRLLLPGTPEAIRTMPRVGRGAAPRP